MTFDDFRKSLSVSAPPSVLQPLLTALWHDARGNWAHAHNITQEIESADAAWVHAYLHRKEGDLGNAGYWYRRAGREVANLALDAEWEQIVRELLGDSESPR